MSKLVVKIRDDDKYFQHCPLQHEGYCHLPQTHCWSGDGNTLYMMECLGTINKRPPWCPLKEEVKAIPIDWIKSWADERCCGDLTIYGELFYDMIDDWKNENEKRYEI